MLAANRVHVVFYEEMIDDPWGQLDRLQAYLHRYGPRRWNLGTVSVQNLERPSHTNYHKADVGSGPVRLEEWVAEVPAARVTKALELVKGFGLDRIYGEVDPTAYPP